MPHGNAKSLKPFFPTLPSTVDRIRSQCSISGPKEVVSSISADAGGILAASYPGELPRDEQQVSQMKKRLPKCMSSSSSKCSADDELYAVMLRAQLEDKKFARDIKTFPEPAIVLASDQQLMDLVRFCSDPFESCILTVDPTFCLGAFDVTPITYRHLLLESVRTGNPPVMIGPTLIHYKKSFQTYLFFASSLVGLNKDLKNIRAFGTDNEKALIDAFTHEFQYAVHVTCFIHVRKNIKDQLAKHSISDEVRSEILDDIFGKRVGSTLLEGLVDSEDDAYEGNVKLLIEKWKEKAVGVNQFCDWFLKNKTDVIRRSMISSIREEAGLGSPPEPFFTNASECVNSIIKVKVDYKSNELPQFITKLRELSAEQEREVEKAVIRRGKYRLRSQYKKLEVNESKWFSMSQEQRMGHLKKLCKTKVSNVDNPDAIAHHSDITPNVMQDNNSPSSISRELMPVAHNINLPTAAIEGIARKASDILNTADGIVQAPGYGNDAVMVLSKSGKMPHLVTVKKNGGMACDKECPQYQSASLCSHVVAAAKFRRKFKDFVASYKVSRKPNLTKLVTCDMPKGRGKKGGRAPPKRKVPPTIENRYPFIPLSHSPSIEQSMSASGCTSPSVDMSPSLYYMPSSSYYTNYSPYSSSPYYPTHPPPIESDHPFRVHFIGGNISVCHGCKGRYCKDLGPPYDLCIQHEEWRTYTVPGYPSPQSKFGNVYYHASVTCIVSVWPSFVPTSLLVPSGLRANLKREHKDWLYSQFGVVID